MYKEELLISVIIPVYNAERYIERCLNSITFNTYKNLEIICINDGSTDASFEKLQKAAIMDKRITIINQKNTGVSAARNAGLNASRGDVIAFIDSDDWIHPQYFELLLSALVRNHADIVVCDMEKCTVYVDTYKDIIGKKQEKQILQSSIESNYVFKSYVWGRLYLRSKIEEEKFKEDLRLGEDTVFNMSVIFRENAKIIFLDEKLYFYFLHNESAVHRISASNLLKSAVYYLERINTGKLSEMGKKIFCIEALKMLLAYRYLSMFEPDKTKIRNECKLRFKQCWRIIKEKRFLIGRERFIYSLLTLSPGLYRAYRIYNDRTMLVWEKNQKSLRK